MSYQQPPMSQPGPNQMSGGQMPGGGMLQVNSKFFPTAAFLYLTGVGLAIDGQEQKLKWGDQQVPVAPGNHHIEMWTRYMGKMGRAGLQCQVVPGQPMPVYYAAPATVFQQGAIGHQPVKVPGGTFALVSNIVAIAIIVLLCLVPLLTGR